MGEQALQPLLDDADVVLAVGTHLIGNTLPTGTPVVHVDVDRAEIGIHRATRCPSSVTPHPRSPRCSPSCVRGAMPRADRGAEITAFRATVDASLRAVGPQGAMVDQLRAAIPDDGVLVPCTTTMGYMSHMLYPAYGPRTYLSTSYMGTLGWGFPAALGVKVARPDTPVVCATGDGGFLFAATELATAVQYGINTVTVVYNDDAYGNSNRDQRERFGGREIGTELRNPDFVKFAESFGADAPRRQGRRRRSRAARSSRQRPSDRDRGAHGPPPGSLLMAWKSRGRRARWAPWSPASTSRRSTTPPSPRCTTRSMEHLVLCIKGQAHATPDDQVAFTARWGRIEPHPYVPPIEGHPEIIEIYDPNPITVTWHSDFTYAKQPPSVSLLLGRIIPPVGGDTMFSNGYLAYEGLSDGLRDTVDHLRAVHYATQLAIDSGMPEDEIVNSHPVACTHPETGRRALFVNDNYTKHFDGWSIDDSQPLLDHLYAQFDKPEHTFRHRWRRATSSSGTTAARSTPSSATPTAPAVHCTARPSQEVPRHDRHPLDRQPRRPRRRSPRRLDLAPAREVPRRRPAHRDGARGHADPRRRHVPRSARDRGARRRLVVLRGPAVLGEAAHRRGGLPARRRSPSTASRSTRCVPGAGSRRPASRT